MSKRLRAQWMRPYSRIEEGISPISIVGYGKYPHLQEYLEETADEEGKNYSTTTQWAYILTLDLWLVKLRFDWLGKELRQQIGAEDGTN
jgi:hypothetical protein